MTSRPPPLPWLEPGDPFPAVEQAWGIGTPAPGLLAAGGALDVASLVQAYAQGIFPWYSDGQPILWWSTDPRMLLRVADFKLQPSLRKTLRAGLRSGRLKVRFDPAYGPWLADRLVEEPPFVGYHAASALWAACRSLVTAERDKLKALVVHQIRDGSLTELTAFVKEGMKAYRLPLPKGEKQPDGSEKVLLDDCRYVTQLSLLPAFQPATAELQASFESFALVASILDDLVSASLGYLPVTQPPLF
ncbi:MAG: leu/Phe-tRNA-protein transferase, partial [Pseudomonadota bacterium]